MGSPNNIESVLELSASFEKFPVLRLGRRLTKLNDDIDPRLRFKIPKFRGELLRGGLSEAGSGQSHKSY
jgi:hypothetical protein